MLLRTKKSFALAAAVMMTAALGGGCSGNKTTQAKGDAKVGVNVAALSATSITKVTLTVGPGNGTPSFNSIVTDMTNQDLTGKLSWSAFVGGIPAGSGRTFHIDAFDATNAIVYTGDATSTITAGATASVFMVLQPTHPDGSFSNFLPVVDSLTSSASIVTVGTTVSLSVTAHDPDPAATLTYSWTSSCAPPTFSGATGTTTTWTAPATVPAAGACQLNITVTDNKQGSVTASLAIVVQNVTSGSAQVNAFPNSWPMISGIVAAETFTKNASGQIVAIDVDLTASATDPDGDDVQYVWSSPDCAFPVAGFTSATVTAMAATITTGPGALATNAVHFKSGDPSHGCTIRVDVTDHWKNGIVPAGSGLPVARGGDTIGLINASTPRDFVLAPQITRAIQPNANNQVQPGQTVVIGVETLDPTPNFNTAQTPFTFAWTQTGGAFVAGSQADVTSSPGKSTIQWTAPSTLAPGMIATVTVTNKAGLTATQTFTLVPANACALPGSNGTACDTGLGACGPNGACSAGVCVSPTPVTCTALDQCHDVGVCNPGTGTCSQPVKAVGTACNDSSGCTTGDVCSAAGACVGAAVVCNTPPGQCFGAIGACTSTGAATFTCGYTPSTAGTVCNDANACTQTDACDGAGACVGSNPVVCASAQCSTGGTCNPANGLCQGGTNVLAGTPCNDANACTTGDACNGSGACVGTPLCAAPSGCSAGVCSPVVPAPQVAKQLTISAMNGIAMDTLGAAYVTGPVFGTKSFDAQTVTSAGSADAFIAKYDPVTRAAVWAKAFGGGAPEATGPTDQLPAGATVTADGTVVIIGNSNGNIVVNPTTTLAIPGLQDFILGVNGTTGAGLWGLTFNNGLGGALISVAANPARNVFAVCGWTDTASPLAPAGTVFGGGTRDAIIAMFNSSGTLVWSKQLGSGSDEECDSLAIDDAGDLYVAGQYNSVTGQTNLNPGLGALPSTGLGTRRWLWVAKYNGLSGAAIAQASFGSGNGNHKAFGLAVDAAGKLVMGGSFTFTLPFGATSLTTAGATDGFVAKLDPAAATPFAPMWAVRVGSPTGDQINSVAVTSFGEVLAAGLFSGTTTGAATLTVAGSADALLLKLDGATGATQFSAGYGDASNQAASNVVANRQGAGAVKDLVEFGGTYAGVITFPAPAGALPASIGDSFLVFAPLQ